MQWHKAAVSWFGTAAQKDCKAAAVTQLKAAALVHWCLVTASGSVCSVDLHRCKCSGTRLLSAGLAQQHRRRRQAVNLGWFGSCSSALVFGDCKSVCSVDLHRCKCSGTRLLSAGLAQQHRRRRQAVNPKSTAAVHWCLVTATCMQCGSP